MQRTREDILTPEEDHLANLMFGYGCGEKKVSLKLWQLHEHLRKGKVEQYKHELRTNTVFWSDRMGVDLPRYCNYPNEITIPSDIWNETAPDEEFTNTEETYMSQTNLLLTQNPDFKYVGCKFLDYDNGKTYHYKTFIDLEVGDYAVIMAPDNHPKVVKVVELINPLEREFDFIMKWIICKVDMTEYERCHEMEKSINTVLNQRKVQNMRTELLESLEMQVGKDTLTQITHTIKGEATHEHDTTNG